MYAPLPCLALRGTDDITDRCLRLQVIDEKSKKATMGHSTA